MAALLERELKLQVGPDFRLPDLSGKPLAPRVFTSVYYDTPDHRLARHGITLGRGTQRHRWQLTLPHTELTVPGGTGAPPEEITRLLVAATRGVTLVPVATLRTRRTGVRAHDLDGPRAEVVLDSVAVLESGRVVRRFREVEAQLLTGDGEALERIRQVLRAAGASDGDGRPKVFQALGIEPRPVPTPDESSLALYHVRAMLQAQVESLLSHDPGVRLGTDPEELHKMRVAVRRLRAILRATRPMFELEWVESLREELAWLGNTLGEVRDLDVMQEYLRQEISATDPAERRAGRRLLRRLEAERTHARAKLMKALGDARYLAVLDRLEGSIEQPKVVEPDFPLREVPVREFKKLRKAVEALPEVPSDETLHEIRIKGKRARYAAELVQALVGKPAERFIAKVKELQDVLGEHQDALVAEARIRALAVGLGGRRTSFMAGRLVERQRARREAARAAFAALWPKLARRGKKTWR
jgi:CHAD domain-containing protein